MVGSGFIIMLYTFTVSMFWMFMSAKTECWCTSANNLMFIEIVGEKCKDEQITAINKRVLVCNYLITKEKGQFIQKIIFMNDKFINKYQMIKNNM